MKIVTGLFSPEDALGVIRRLVRQGFTYDDLSMMSNVAEIPDYLEGKPEKSAASGAAAGAAAGGAIGALGSVIASTIPGFETMFVSGLMTTAVGGVIGGYLGSLYNVRNESQTKIDIHEALEAGDYLIITRANKANDKTAETIMTRSNGRHIEIHTIPTQGNGQQSRAPLDPDKAMKPQNSIDTQDPVDEQSWESFPASDPPPY